MLPFDFGPSLRFFCKAFLSAFFCLFKSFLAAFPAIFSLFLFNLYSFLLLSCLSRSLFLGSLCIRLSVSDKIVRNIKQITLYKAINDKTLINMYFLIEVNYY